MADHAVAQHCIRRALVEVLNVMLDRAGWVAEQGHGRVRCRDHRRRRTKLLVLPTRSGVVLVASRPGPISLRPLEVGQLRGALKAAVLISANPSTPIPRVAVDLGFWDVAA